MHGLDINIMSITCQMKHVKNNGDFSDFFHSVSKCALPAAAAET